MKVKTSELSGIALDYTVAICEGIPEKDLFFQKWGGSLYRRNKDEDGRLDGTYTTGPALLFSRKWEAGGLIIERELITVLWNGAQWIGSKYNVRVDGEYEFQSVGHTPLIAAMRCYVASKLGDEVEIPDELLN